ncbi:hypothetical protein OKA05_16260 [Luteolibacter arcticus]|uniref:Uncharacterized protein n=1 Tax=Luteolibacter arcticus TaxID=1581411 RepID=A0ABT3GKU1_9BACT|nr:hypothetical protein [Luteolibacter arcticus]MCW1924122.1 hypothetical protein [Luteolibacter arcticus]
MATICSLIAGASAAFIYVQWREINEFTFMITFLPLLTVIALAPLSVVLWIVTWVKYRNLR